MSRDAVLHELKAMSKRELRLTLQAFAPDEREKIVALVERRTAAAGELPFATLAALSPWLLKAIGPAGTAVPGAKLTPATRTALKDALELVAATGPQRRGDAGDAPGTFVGRLLRRHRQARGR